MSFPAPLCFESFAIHSAAAAFDLRPKQLRIQFMINAAIPLSLGIFTLGLAACSSEPDQDPYQQLLQKARMDAYSAVEQQNREWEASKGPAPYGAEACAASLAVLMSENPSTMKRWKIGPNEFGIRYRRDDGKMWEYRCDAKPDRLRWHSFENGTEGRERADDNIRYNVSGSVLNLTIAGMDGDYDYKFSLPSLRQLPKRCDVPSTCGTPHKG